MTTAWVKGAIPLCVATRLILNGPVVVRAVHVGAVLHTVSKPVEALILNFPASVPVNDHVPENAGDADIVAMAVNTVAFAEPDPTGNVPVAGATPVITWVPVITTA